MASKQKPQIAFVTLGDNRQEFFEKRRNIVEAELAEKLMFLREKYVVFQPDIVFSVEDALRCSDEIRSRRINCVIIHLPVWATPNLALRIANSTSLPVLILGNRRKDSSSLVSLLAIGGLLDQTGKQNIRLIGDTCAYDVKQTIIEFVTACHVVSTLKRSSYCLIGGRSIGIGTTVADPSQWQELFGVEFDHCDQFEIVYRSREISESRVQTYKEWLNKTLRVEYGGLFTEQKLELQIRSYLALKELVFEKGYDFLGLKCQTELSDHFVLQCLAVSLLNNDYDAEGEKEVIPTSCESDCDGALTMKILSLCSHNCPSSLVDIKFFDGETREFILANCGAMAPYFAGGLQSEANKKITMMPHVFGKAGGGSVQMIAHEGVVTVARLHRMDRKYVMSCFEGVMEERPIEELKKSSWCYPHQFIKADIDYDLFFEKIGSNHLHTVYGQYCGVLKNICKILGIEYIQY